MDTMDRMNNIRKAQIKDCRTIIDILNRTTLFLHNKGIFQWEYPWDDVEIKEDIILGSLYVLEISDQIIGTFGLKPKISIGDISLEDSAVYLYQIAIDPAHQGSGHGRELIDFCKEIREIIYLDCWSGNLKLRDFYMSNGFEYIKDLPEEDFFVSVFRWESKPLDSRL